MPVRGSRLDHLLLLILFPGLILVAVAIEQLWLAPHRAARPAAERVAVWRDYVEQHPNFVMGHIRLGQVLVETGDPVAAGAAFRRALEVDPDSVAAAIGLSDTHRTQGDLQGSLAVMEGFLETHPGCFECLQNIASDRFSLGDLDGALAAIEQLVGRRGVGLPSVAGTNLNLATTKLLAGRIYEAQGRSEEAREFYEAALRLDPMLPLALLRVAESEMGRDPAAAVELLNRYRQLRPRDPQGARLLAEALSRIGDEAAARRVLADQRSAATQPRHLPAP